MATNEEPRRKTVKNVSKVKIPNRLVMLLRLGPTRAEPFWPLMSLRVDCPLSVIVLGIAWLGEADVLLGLYFSESGSFGLCVFQILAPSVLFCFVLVFF